MLKLTQRDDYNTEVWLNPDAIMSFQKSGYATGTNIQLSNGIYLAVIEEPAKVAWDIKIAYQNRSRP